MSSHERRSTASSYLSGRPYFSPFAVAPGLVKPWSAPLVRDEAAVGAGVRHLLLEIRDVLAGDERVGGSVADEHLRLHLAPRRLVERTERAVEAHHALEIHADARAVQHHRAAEAVADRGQAARIGRRMPGERIVRGLEPGGAGVHVRQHGRSSARPRRPHRPRSARSRTCRRRAPRNRAPPTCGPGRRCSRRAPHHSCTTSTPGRGSSVEPSQAA